MVKFASSNSINPSHYYKPLTYSHVYLETATVMLPGLLAIFQRSNLSPMFSAYVCVSCFLIPERLAEPRMIFSISLTLLWLAA